MVLDACFCLTPQRIEKKRKEEKMAARMNTSVAALILLGLIFYGGRGGEAQDTSCLPALTPCSSYLNTTGTPDKTCCDGLISVIDKNAKCLCGLLNSTIVKQLGINMTKAMELPARCGKNVTADQCSKINSSGGAPTATPVPTPTPTSDSSSIGAPTAAPTSGGSSTPGTSPSSSPKGDSSTPGISPSSFPTGDSSTPGISPSSSSKGDSSGASSLVSALFSSVSLVAFFSLGLASQMLMEGGGL